MRDAASTGAPMVQEVTRLGDIARHAGALLARIVKAWESGITVDRADALTLSAVRLLVEQDLVSELDLFPLEGEDPSEIHLCATQKGVSYELARPLADGTQESAAVTVATSELVQQRLNRAAAIQETGVFVRETLKPGVGARMAELVHMREDLFEDLPLRAHLTFTVDDEHLAKLRMTDGASLCAFIWTEKGEAR